MKTIRNSAKDSIVTILKMHNNRADFTTDENVNDCNDEDFDDDFEYNNRVWIECYGKYNNETGYVTMVELDKNNDIIITAEGDDFTYDTDYVCHSTPAYLDILERLEFMENHGMF